MKSTIPPRLKWEDKQSVNYLFLDMAQKPRFKCKSKTKIKYYSMNVKKDLKTGQWNVQVDTKTNKSNTHHRKNKIVKIFKGQLIEGKIRDEHEIFIKAGGMKVNHCRAETCNRQISKE